MNNIKYGREIEKLLIVGCFTSAMLLAGCDLGIYDERVEANGGKLPSSAPIAKANGVEQQNAKTKQQQSERELDEAAARSQVGG